MVHRKGAGQIRNPPNPFNPATTIRFRLPSETRVVLTVHDILGRSVETVLDEVRQPGEHTVLWEARGLPSGVYYYALKAGTFRETKKLLLIR